MLKISGAELDILKVLWQDNAQTATNVHARVSDKKD